MEVYMRLIEEGVFVFWNDESDAHTYDLKISIFVGEKKVPIVHKKFDSSERYFSLTGIGAGDYEIELNGYEDTRLFQTEVKKCNIKSVSQQHAEMMEKVEAVRLAVSCLNTSSINTIVSILKDPNDYCDMGSWTHFIGQCYDRINNPTIIRGTKYY